jgi:hypothetical protein
MFTVPLRGIGVFLALVVLTLLVVMHSLQVVVSGGRVVGGGLVMVIGSGVLGGCRHRSILPRGIRVLGHQEFVVGSWCVGFRGLICAKARRVNS